MYRYRNGKAPGMFAAVAPILTLIVAAAILVRADPNPSSPGPGDVFIEGQPCTITWDIDHTGAWKTMNIELMTGDNFDMVSLARASPVSCGAFLVSSECLLPLRAIISHMSCTSVRI